MNETPQHNNEIPQDNEIPQHSNEMPQHFPALTVPISLLMFNLLKCT